jgi:Predicted membrane protein
MKNKKIGLTVSGSIAVGIAAMLWGIDGVLFTPQLQNLNASFVVFIINLFPFLLMNLFFYKKYTLLKSMSLSDFKFFVLIALFGGVLGTLSMVKALFLLDFNNLSVIVLLQKLQPIFAIILARILLKEKVKKNFVFWASVTIISGYFLTFGMSLPDFSTKGINTVYAALLSLLAAFSFGSSTVFSKKILADYSFASTTFYRYFFTTVIAFFVVIFNGHICDFSQVTPKNWLFVAIIGLTSGTGAIFLYYYGLRNIKASLSTIIELLYPISAVLLDSIVNKTVYSPTQWTAALVMFFAIIKLNLKDKEDSK